MIKRYTGQTVYDALQERLRFVFSEFDNVFVSFSGGKDSGLLLELVLDFQKRHCPEKRIGVFHQDFEAQYSATTAYVERTFDRLEREPAVEPYWVCLPMATRTALSSYEMFWYPWDDERQEAWVRPLPKRPYVISLENNPMTTYRYKMHQKISRASSAGGTARRTAAARRCVCWASGPTNRCTATAASSTNATAIRAHVGSPSSSRTCGAPVPSTIGR